MNKLFGFISCWLIVFCFSALAQLGTIPYSGAIIPPADNLSPTGAWSFSRQLLSSYSGNAGAFYLLNSGAIRTLYDQSGSNRDMSQGSPSARPVLGTGGSNNRVCGDFDGTNDGLASTGFALSTFISASSGYMIASIVIDSFPTNSASSFNNSVVLLDTGKFAGMTVRSGNIFYAYNWDGNEDKAQGTTNVSTSYVVEWRHESGTLYQRVNGAGETSVASGNTSTLTGTLDMGGLAGNQPFDGRICEALTFSSIPAQSNRDILAANMLSWIGQ